MKHDLDRQSWTEPPLVVGFLAGLLCGLGVLGLGGRLVMSVIALALGARVEWDVGGTMQVVILGTALGPPAGLAFIGLRGRLSQRGWLRGLVFGLGYATLLTAIYFLRPAGPVELRAAPVLGSILFGSLVIVFGLALEVTVARLLPRVPAPSKLHQPWVRIVIAIAALASAGLALYALVSR